MTSIPDVGDVRKMLAQVGAQHGLALRLLSRAVIGEGGAYFVEDDQGRRLVFKTFKADGENAGNEFRPQFLEITGRLRDCGYPAPRYVAVGECDNVPYTLQETIPGRARPQYSANQIAQIIALNRLQAGRGEGLDSGWPARVVKGVLVGFRGYCEIETLRRHSAETSALLTQTQEIVKRHSSACTVTRDIVHWDFNPGNILVDGDAIKGVIDWEGACTGDRAFDLATLIFYKYDDDAVREPLMHEALRCSGALAMSVYFAHMIVRQIEWSARHHTPQVVANYISTAARILAEIESHTKVEHNEAI